MMEKIDELEVGDTFFFDKVLLVASDEYTAIGRPNVQTAKVLACVQEHSLTEKVIVFKKKRRRKSIRDHYRMHRFVHQIMGVLVAKQKGR